MVSGTPNWSFEEPSRYADIVPSYAFVVLKALIASDFLYSMSNLPSESLSMNSLYCEGSLRIVTCWKFFALARRSVTPPMSISSMAFSRVQSCDAMVFSKG